MKKIKIEIKYCPKCGEKLCLNIIPNEKTGIKLLYFHPNDAYDEITGERLYSFKAYCPRKSFWGKCHFSRVLLINKSKKELKNLYLSN